MADLNDPIALNVSGVSQLIGSKLNKVSGEGSQELEGIDGEKVDVLSLDMSDEKLLELRDDWESQYAGYEASINVRQEANKIYYMGKQLEGSPLTSEFPIASNLQWEAAETFYPAALSKNPEPVTYCDNTPEGNELASDIKTMLQYHADYLDLRSLLTLQTRQWSIYFLGVKKWGWDNKTNEVTVSVRRIQDFVFDREGYVDTKCHFTSYLGERITVTAEKLIELFPKSEVDITLEVDGKLGTKVTYTEWWTDEFCFVTFKKIILDKHKNEFFNHPTKQTDEYGLEDDVDGQNHFAYPLKPYTFLSVYSLAEQPHDITNNMEQNIPNQNLVSKRTMQIDANLSKQNNSRAYSENNFNQETAKQASNAMAKGNPVLVPQGGPISEAIHDFPAQGYSDSAFKELEMNKEALRQSWGVEGITATPPDENSTARGMILNGQHSNSRLGGGIGEAIERVAKADFNWLVQLYYVFYDEPHIAAVLGQMKGTEFVTLHAGNLNRKVIVTVSPDSMKPKDEITEMNQAMTLWQEGALDPLTLHTLLNMPNPKETAAQTWLYHTNPALYGQMNFPDLQQEIMQASAIQNPMGAPGVGAPPSEATPGQPNQGNSVQGEAPPTTGGVQASPALSQVPLPK